MSPISMIRCPIALALGVSLAACAAAPPPPPAVSTLTRTFSLVDPVGNPRRDRGAGARR
jgi:hypothetical protein